MRYLAALLLALMAFAQTTVVRPIDPGAGASTVVRPAANGGTAVIGNSAFTYYVDPNGSDSANGLTPATAWKTVAKVNATTLTAGQSVGFKRGGVWRESLIPGQSGTAGHPITFGAYGVGAQPCINCEPAGFFTANAESGDTSDWTSVTATPTSTFTASAASLFRGNYGYRAHSDGTHYAYATKTVAGQTDLYVRFWFKLDTAYAQAADYGYTDVFGLYVGGTRKLKAYIQQYPGPVFQFHAALDFGSYTNYGTGSFARGAWHHVDIHYVVSGTVGGFQAWFDGVSLGSIFTQNAAGSIDTIKLGMISQAPPAAGSDISFGRIKASTSILVSPTTAVDLNGKSYITLQDLTIAEAGDVGVFLRGGSNYNTIQRLTVRDVYQDVGYQSGVLVMGGSNNLVTGNTIYNAAVGVQVSGYGSVVSDANTVTGNVVHDINDTGISEGPAGGRNPVGTVVTRNTIYAAAKTVDDRPGIMFSGGGAGTVATYNTIYNIGTATARGEGIEADTGTVGVLLAYNVIFGCTNGAIGLTNTGHLVYHNSTYGNNTAGYDAGELQVWGSGSGMVVKNNVFVASAGKQLLSASTGNITGHTLDYNLWYGGSATPFQWGATNYSYANYLTAASQDAHSVNADPTFTNAASGDFTLLPGSPAIGTGVYIPGVSISNPSNIGAK